MNYVKYKNEEFKGQLESSVVRKILARFPKENKDEVKLFVSKNVRTEKKTSLKFSSLVAGAKAIVNIVAGDIVTQSEINRRSSICNGCRVTDENGNLVNGVAKTDDCLACGFASRLARWNREFKTQFKTKHTIPNNQQGRGCIVCKCSLDVMLISKMSAFDYEKDVQEQRPDHCWVKRTSPNYRGSV